MKKRIGFFIMAILFFISGCSEKEVSIDYILALLDDHDIAYEEQEEIHPSNELRETIDNHVFELEEGRLRVHFFATEEDRKEVQKDPYPAAVFVATSGYGKDNVLIYRSEERRVGKECRLRCSTTSDNEIR